MTPTEVLTIAVQNTVDYADLGTATSGVTFFRTLGSAFGTAVFGTIYANALTPNLRDGIAQAVAAGLRGAGCDVVDIGVVPTPTVAIMVDELRAAGGI